MRSISSSRRRHSSMFRADVHECVEAGDPYLGSYGYCASVRPSRFATHVETGRPHQIHARRMPHGARAVPFHRSPAHAAAFEVPSALAPLFPRAHRIR
jgi:hypothetical protein